MNGAAMMSKPKNTKRPRKVAVIDESFTDIIITDAVQFLRIKDESTKKNYRIQRMPVKRGLQMTGA